jgi:hypothetical protein
MKFKLLAMLVVSGLLQTVNAADLKWEYDLAGGGGYSQLTADGAGGAVFIMANGNYVWLDSKGREIYNKPILNGANIVAVSARAFVVQANNPAVLVEIDNKGRETVIQDPNAEVNASGFAVNGFDQSGFFAQKNYTSGRLTLVRYDW